MRKLLTLLILSSLTGNLLFGQSDSIELRREILEVLKKHGYTSFQININSYNQSGGQTAFSITNNYNAIPNYIPDSINFDAGYIDSLIETFAIFPKYDSWLKPFVIYPDTFILRIHEGKPVTILGYCDGSHYSGFRSDGQYEVIYKGKKYPSECTFLDIVCSKSMPLCTNIKYKNCFFIFGDYSDQNKWYVFDYGKFKWFKSDTNFYQFIPPLPPRKAFIIPER